MTRTHDIARRRARNRIALVGALLLATAASFALAVPERASAANPPCPAGHICIWEHAGFKGGRYNSSGFDMELTDNFFPKTRRTVGDRASAIYNNGNPGGRDGALFSMRVDDDVDRKHAPRFCLREGTLIGNLDSWYAGVGRPWNDSIAGYRWVTDRVCRDIGTP